MADNFLEKRMADYRSGKLGVSARKSRAVSERGHLSFKMPEQTVFVIGVPDEAVADAMNRLVKSGCNVAMVHGERQLGNVVAQRTGALFYPVSEITGESIGQAVDFAVKRWNITPACAIITDEFLKNSSRGELADLANVFQRVIIMASGPVDELDSSSVAVLYHDSAFARAAMTCAFLTLPEFASEKVPVGAGIIDLR